MTDLIEKLLITIAVYVFALSYTLRSVEASGVPREPRKATASVDAPDPVDSGASFK